MYKTVVRPAMMNGAETFGSEEIAGEEVGRGRNEDVEMDVWSYKNDRIWNEIIRSMTKVGEISSVRNSACPFVRDK